MPFDRYQDVIPDFDLFVECLSHPEPTTIRVRTGRIDPDSLLDRLERQGYALRALEGQPGFFEVLCEPEPVALTVEHWLGLFYVQRASTGLAAPVLGPRPGERVLDLCAAPGGKTTHMADLMCDRGPLVAVEPNESRIRALAGNVYRTAHVNVMTVAADGRFLPGGALFDRVLVDAPCSAEGTVRESRGRIRTRTARFENYITNLQTSLLRRAIELTRPGGWILYSTCTFAPEENEAVVDAVIRDMPVDLVPLQPGVPFAPGLTSFEGHRFDDCLHGAARIYPHQLNSGGLFLALLQKTSRPRENHPHHDPDAGWSAIPECSGDTFPIRDSQDRADLSTAGRIDAVKAALEDVWKVEPAALDGIEWLIRNGRAWAHGCREWPFETWAGNQGWKSVSIGLRSFSFDTGGLPRPSNDWLRWLGARFAARQVHLSWDEWRAMLDGNRVPTPGVTDGYAALMLDGLAAGRGFVRAETVRHEIPGVHTATLRRVLATRSAGDRIPDSDRESY